jgi:hypothetical protein
MEGFNWPLSRERILLRCILSRMEELGNNDSWRRMNYLMCGVSWRRFY